jgi:hypothetical protein
MFSAPSNPVKAKVPKEKSKPGTFGTWPAFYKQPGRKLRPTPSRNLGQGRGEWAAARHGGTIGVDRLALTLRLMGKAGLVLESRRPLLGQGRVTIPMV